MGAILEALAVAARWLLPSLVGYVASDVINNHENAHTEDTIRQVASDAAGTARQNWVKWVVFGVISICATAILLLVFKIKNLKK